MCRRCVPTSMRRPGGRMGGGAIGTKTASDCSDQDSFVLALERAPISTDPGRQASDDNPFTIEALQEHLLPAGSHRGYPVADLDRRFGRRLAHDLPGYEDAAGPALERRGQRPVEKHRCAEPRDFDLADLFVAREKR